jgi:O-succinylbenzoate synthase
MHIDSLELFHVALPLRQPLRTRVKAFQSLETVLVRMRSGEAAGWGEASPGNAPLAGPEWAAGVFACLRDWLAPALCGAALDFGSELEQRLEPFRANRFAKGALDAAWWDLKARLEGQPLHELLGGSPAAIEVGVTFDQMDSPDEFLAAIARALEAGFPRVKLKFRPGWDVRMVDAVRKEFPTGTFHIDCEGALTLAHFDMLCRLDDFNLAMIEQPLGADDLVGHAMLQEAVRTPICLDEGITSVAQAELALELKSCKYMSIKPGRVGGLTPALAIDDLCVDNHVDCWLGAVPQSAIGARIGFALAARPNFTYPADFFPSDQLLEQDLAPPLLPMRDESDEKQRVRLWSEPGIGVEPAADVLEKFCIARTKVDSQT